MVEQIILMRLNMKSHDSLLKAFLWCENKLKSIWSTQCTTKPVKNIHLKKEEPLGCVKWSGSLQRTKSSVWRSDGWCSCVGWPAGGAGWLLLCCMKAEQGAAGYYRLWFVFPTNRAAPISKAPALLDNSEYFLPHGDFILAVRESRKVGTRGVKAGAF